VNAPRVKWSITDFARMNNPGLLEDLWMLTEESGASQILLE